MADLTSDLRDRKPHIYYRYRRWLVKWRHGTEGWMLIAAHDWCAQRNAS